jgi:hypothetical protein
MRPRRTVLHQHQWSALSIRGTQQQPGCSETSPPVLTVAAMHPAVAVGHHLARHPIYVATAAVAET